MTRAYLTPLDLFHLSRGRICKLRPVVVTGPVQRLFVRPIRLTSINLALKQIGV